MDLWWLTPLALALLVGLICPTTGSLLITQRRILLANLMAHSVLPGLVIALAFEWDPMIGGLISGLVGALIAERLNQRFRGREDGAMNTVLAGFTALGVLLVPLLEARVDLETVLFGDLLAATSGDLIRTGVAAVALLLLVIGLLCAPVLVHVDHSISLRSLIARSAGTGLLLCGGGLGLAMVADLPPGPLIGVLCVVSLILKLRLTDQKIIR